MENWLLTTLTVAAGFLTIFNLVDRIIQYASKPKETTDEIKRRLEALERKTDEDFKRKFDNIDNEIGKLKESNEVTQRAILALLEHSIDGNNTAGLKKAKDDLNEYLTKSK